MFDLPNSAAGKSFVRELTRLIENWTDMSEISGIALKALMVMPALLLQKPTRKSSSKQHKEYLIKRLDLWRTANFEELLKEGRQIQHKMKQNVRKDDTPDETAKRFAKLMLQGKVNGALRLLNKQEAVGVAKLDISTVGKLRELHPEATPSSTQKLMQKS